LIAVVLLAVAILSPVQSAFAGRRAQSPGPVAELSPYWSSAVRQWESIILEEAARRGLDPDLIGALIWKESRGRASARGPAGAVGLMMVMPRDAGFTWRPPASELRDPAVNVFWGARALATTVHDSGGDLYSALAAYNGGWDQIHLRGPRQYATDVLNDYARAVAVRNSLSPQIHWVATVTALHGTGPMSVLGPQRSLTRYSRAPVVADIPDCTIEGPPTAVVFSSPNGHGMNSRVGIWILLDGVLVVE
jgi:hypothetical protein